MKVDINNLYVACRVYEDETEIEPWVQYESFGELQHDIYVSPKRTLLIREEVNGEEVFVDYDRNVEVELSNYTNSYTSKSNNWASLCHSGFPLGPFTEDKRQYFLRKNRKVQFLMPFSEFMKEEFGRDVQNISPFLANQIVHLANIRRGKTFYLSEDPVIAQAQIEKKVLKRKKR